MNVARRNKKLKALLDVRIGPGAAVLPHDVKRIHLDFAYKLEGGHLGPRKFWRQYLPRLKYHNPAVSMTIKRTNNQEGPATLSIFLSPLPQSDSSTSSLDPLSSTSEPNSSTHHTLVERVETFDVKNIRESEILKRLLDMTRAQPYEASTEEKAESQEVKEFKERSEMDRKAQDKLNKIRAEEKAMLEQARGAVS